MEGNAGGSSVRKIEGQVLYNICKVFLPKKILETGTHHGASTNYLLKYAQEDRATVYSFDVSSKAGSSIIKELKSNLVLKKSRRKIFPNKVTQADITKIRNLVVKTAQQGVDLFFHDSDHCYDNAKWEFDNITPYMKKNSPVIFHDVLHKTDKLQTNKLFDEIKSSWKHVFNTPSGMGLIVL